MASTSVLGGCLAETNVGHLADVHRRLVLEPWMLPKEWAAMGGQQCSDCSQCIASELYGGPDVCSVVSIEFLYSAYAQAYPKTVDSAFNTHWYVMHKHIFDLFMSTEQL
jgi:hypothetical protein